MNFYVQTPPQRCKSETKIPVQKVRKTQKGHKKINPGVCRHTGSKNEAWLRGCFTTLYTKIKESQHLLQKSAQKDIKKARCVPDVNLRHQPFATRQNDGSVLLTSRLLYHTCALSSTKSSEFTTRNAKRYKKINPRAYVAIHVPRTKLGFRVDLLYYTPKLKKVNAFCKNRQTCGACKRLREAAGNGFATETGKARRQTRFLCRCAHKRDAFSSVPFVVLRGSLPSKRCFVCVLR